MEQDAIAEARKDKNFKRNFNGASLRLRLADEVYEARMAMGLSQQDLANNIHSSQKVISHIENGDVNIGIEMLGRLSETLHFSKETLYRVIFSTK